MYTEEELQEMCIGDLIALILELQETKVSKAIKLYYRDMFKQI